MFGLFKARCPLGTWEKFWTEYRMRWLAEHLGPDRLLGATVITPTPEFFPDPYHNDEASARRLLDRVAGYMRVDPGRLRFEVCEDFQLPGAAGHYDASQGVTVRIAYSQL